MEEEPIFPFTILGSPELKGKYDFSFTPVGIPGMSENTIIYEPGLLWN
jgi:hypothetical protein